jgi:N4-gp56 family major capsid protein
MSVATSSTLTQEFVDQLSQQMILEADASYVFSQLANAARAGAMGIPDIVGRSGVGANMQEAMGAGMGTLKIFDPRWMSVGRDFAQVVSEPALPGKVILLDQPRYFGGLFTESSRALTEGTRITANPQAATMGQVSVTIKEYAGPHDSSNVAPIGITDFLKRRARHDLIEYIGTLLRRDRNRFVDTVIINLLLTTTNETTPGGRDESILSSGIPDWMTEATLASAFRSLSERNVPTFSNGMYMCVMTPWHFEKLRADDKFRESVRYLGVEGALISGHIANHAGFMLVQSNNLPTKAVGAGGAETGYQALAFGPSAIGWAIGMDAEARRSKDDDFGREDRVVWTAHEGWQLLDATFVQKIVTV